MVNCVLMKLFKTSNIEIINECRNFYFYDSLYFVVNRFFMKLFKTNNRDTVSYCRIQFNFIFIFIHHKSSDKNNNNNKKEQLN